MYLWSLDNQSDYRSTLCTRAAPRVPRAQRNGYTLTHCQQIGGSCCQRLHLPQAYTALWIAPASHTPTRIILATGIINIQPAQLLRADATSHYRNALKTRLGPIVEILRCAYRPPELLLPLSNATLLQKSGGNWPCWEEYLPAGEQYVFIPPGCSLTPMSVCG